MLTEKAGRDGPPHLGSDLKMVTLRFARATHANHVSNGIAANKSNLHPRLKFCSGYLVAVEGSDSWRWMLMLMLTLMILFAALSMDNEKILIDPCALGTFVENSLVRKIPSSGKLPRQEK